MRRAYCDRCGREFPLDHLRESGTFLFCRDENNCRPSPTINEHFGEVRNERDDLRVRVRELETEVERLKAATVETGFPPPEPLIEGHATDCRCEQCGQEWLKANYERDDLRTALRMACERIADGPQEYHEAKSAEDWAAEFLALAQGPEKAT